MGTVFELVADHALVTSDDGPCHVCGIDEREVYPYWGEIVDPRPDEEPEVECACKACIQSGRLRWGQELSLAPALGAQLVRRKRPDPPNGRWRPDEEKRRVGLKTYLRFTYAADWQGSSKRLWKRLCRTPQVVSYEQDADWVVCCNELCEAQGTLATLEALVEKMDAAQYWSHGPKDTGRRDFRNDGPPESLDEVAFFRCQTCEKDWFIDQFT